ncbi:hypothetical protein SOV_22580 [Sporomusa ovata DSM 2662]|uniref:Uncharacterized protein n=1 Tax=Sporomusa ovata TaxID=2378 RepID=A0A0U1L363_9FIRM|nr:hypothetical protein [Sporomusa ovata]EQB25574.1 hypothetical protein SOV_4c02370 [Sporomusa ovata DSM 2662]CQR74132.1 hypothetical protein SpAn4DRAFT_0594 [Sporomusa ovata]
MKQYTPNDWPTQIKKSDSIEKTDKKCFQFDYTKFQQGYQDAISLDWPRLTNDEAIRFVTGYTHVAMKKCNAYLIGYACGVQDAVRRVAA